MRFKSRREKLFTDVAGFARWNLRFAVLFTAVVHIFCVEWLKNVRGTSCCASRSGLVRDQIELMELIHVGGCKGCCMLHIDSRSKAHGGGSVACVVLLYLERSKLSGLLSTAVNLISACAEAKIGERNCESGSEAVRDEPKKCSILSA